MRTCLFLALMLAGSTCMAEPFDSLEVGGLLVQDVSNNTYHEYWQQGWGGELFAQTPFYYGSVRIGLRYTTSTAERDTDVPDSRTLYLYLGWSFVDISIVPQRIRLEGGAGVGVNQWHFIGESNEGLAREIEAAVELYARAQYVITHGWNMNISVRYQSSYTWYPIDLTFITVGASRSLSMPGWLKGFLQ